VPDLFALSSLLFISRLILLISATLYALGGSVAFGEQSHGLFIEAKTCRAWENTTYLKLY